MVTFSVGELFVSFAEVQEKVLAYSEENFCHFYVKDSKKLTAEDTVNPDLVYKHISYSCIYGGQKARFRGSGTRSVTSIRHGCSSCIYFRATRDRQNLQVRNFVDTHNHEITEELYRSASQDRRLPWDLKLEVEELLLLGADKDHLIDYIRSVTNKTVDKKHLFNLYETAVKHQREITRDRALLLLQKVYGVETDADADVILNNLLESSRPPRKSRKLNHSMPQENDDSVQYTYINDGGEGELNEELQRIMGTLQPSENERIVIVEDDEQYEVIEAEHAMEAEYLEEEGELDVKDPGLVRDNESVISNASGRFQLGKRSIANQRLGRSGKYSIREIDPTSHKVRGVSNSSVDDHDPITPELADLQKEVAAVKKEKLSTEIEILKTKKKKLTTEIANFEILKSKLLLEVDVLKNQKTYLDDKKEAIQLKKEKLRLEIANLKGESK